jgi:hypothetical protein
MPLAGNEAPEGCMLFGVAALWNGAARVFLNAQSFGK